MTPRAFWDRHGGLLEENPDDRSQVRYVWTGRDLSVCRPQSEWGGSYGSRWIAELVHGPLIPTA